MKKEVLEIIEKATKCKACVLHKKNLGKNKSYQIALIDEEYGMQTLLTIVHSYFGAKSIWYIYDYHPIVSSVYCVEKYTLDKIEEGLKQCGQSK